MSEEVKAEAVTTAEQPAVGREETARGKKPLRNKRKVCVFCVDKVQYIDYKDVNRLKKYVTEKGKIVARRQTGLCAAHQRQVTTAVRRARNMSLL